MHPSNNPPIQQSPPSRQRERPAKDTVRRNLNRGYMKLDVWERGMALFELAFEIAQHIQDWKLRSQILDAAQSVSANIAEGYGRRTLPEYILFLYYSKGSLAEVLTRIIGSKRVRLITPKDFEQFDALHYEVENKLLSLITSLESEPAAKNWQTRLPTPIPPPRING